jgi:hypothetical protein
MLKPSTKSTALEALSGFLLGTILTSPYWFPGIWQLLSKETFLEWLRGAWPTMTSSLYLYFKLFLYAIAVGLFLVILWAIHQQKKQYVWLETIADEDDANIEDRIQVFPLLEATDGPRVRPHLSGDEPYIELRAIIQNNTIYPLKFDHLEGKFYLDKGPLHLTPQPVNKTFTINRIKPYKLKLIQPIQKTTAERIQQKGKATIAGGKITIHCTYKNQTGETKPARIFLEGLTFDVTPE